MGRTAASVSSVLGLGIVLFLGGCADAGVTPNARVESDLAELAKAALEAKNAALVSDQGPSRSYSINSESYAGAIQGDLSAIAARRAALRREGHSYTGFTTAVDVLRSEVRENEATLSATEHTVLSQVVRDVSGVPSTTEYVQEHEFRFAKRNGAWYLLEDRLINTLGSKDPFADSVHLEPVAIPREDAEWEIRASQAESYSHPDAAFRSALAAGESVSKSAVVWYAYQYWQNYNPKYRKFANDCTNFVSQAMRHGGWSQNIGYALYKYPTVWWYDGVTQSWSWVNANVWFGWVSTRPRGRFTSDFSRLVPGDVVQADWDLDGIVDHTMIVTAKDGAGKLYLTYHSSNTKDRRFDDIRASLPRAAYYGWSLYGS